MADRPTTLETFKICSFNCNGLTDNRKQKYILDFLRKLKCEIYFLQETHITTASKPFLRSCWGYEAWTCGINTNKNGVSILFNNKFDHKVIEVIKDEGGCYIAMNVEILQKRVTLVNVYGPSTGDKP
jgi:exonuclease III